MQLLVWQTLNVNHFDEFWQHAIPVMLSGHIP